MLYLTLLCSSPLKFTLHMKPMNLEREFFSPHHQSSPPNIERLRLFDTPHTPRSLVRRSSASSRQCSELGVDSLNPFGLRRCACVCPCVCMCSCIANFDCICFRSSRMVRSGPQLQRHQSKGTNINPFTPKVFSHGKRQRDM